MDFNELKTGAIIEFVNGRYAVVLSDLQCDLFGRCNIISFPQTGTWEYLRNVGKEELCVNRILVPMYMWRLFPFDGTKEALPECEVMWQRESPEKTQVKQLIAELQQQLEAAQEKLAELQ